MPVPPESERGVPEGARAHLERILASPLFERSPRQSSFLRFVVEKLLAGEGEQIKEYEIAVNVYGRRTDHSTRADPIVRVEAARLRAKLLEYYSTEGQHEEFRIDLPKGAYVPAFVAPRWPDTIHEDAPAGAVPDREPSVGLSEETRRPRRGLRWIAAVAGTGAAVWLIWTFGSRPTGSPPVAPDTKIPDSIAVLPILDQTPGHNQRQLSVGVTEALIAEMRQRNSPHWHIRTAIINGVPGGGPALANQHADAVLSGNVSVNGDVVRVTGSLEHVPSKIVLWNGAVERKLAEWPEAERGLMFEDIAFAIADSLHVTLMERNEEELAAVYPRRGEARHAWLEADLNGGVESVRRAIRLLEKAEALDPNFAWIHASLAYAYVRAVELGLAPEAMYRRRASEQAARALKLGPYLATANAASAWVSLSLDWNIQAASATCTSALNTLSANSSIRVDCAEVYSLAGRNEMAAALVMRSLRRSTRKTIPLTDLALVRYRARQFEEAQSLAEKALTLEPGSVPARSILALSQMASNHPDRALAVLRSGGTDHTGRTAALASTALAMLGDRLAAEAELLQAERDLARPDRTDLIRPYLALSPMNRAFMDRARAAIEEATGQKNVNLLGLMVDPQIAGMDTRGLFDQVRSRPRN